VPEWPRLNLGSFELGAPDPIMLGSVEFEFNEISQKKVFKPVQNTLAYRFYQE
jgi:hypothetical protein